MSLRVKIDLPKPIRGAIRHAWSVLVEFLDLSWTESKDTCDILIGMDASADIKVSDTFLHMMVSKSYRHEDCFIDEPVILDSSGVPDYLGSAFYAMNCLQEYGSDSSDKYGRFRYVDSWQYRFDCVDRPVVMDYFRNIFDNVICLKSSVKWPMRPSQLCVTHDIDFLYRMKYSRPIFHLKRGEVFQACIGFFKELHSHSARNIDHILDMVNGFGYKSIFFWLLDEKSKMLGHVKVQNSDYDLNSEYVRSCMQRIEALGSFNGLHKSVSDLKFQEELTLFPGDIRVNRNHYLLFRLPSHLNKLDESNIDEDHSLGFAETWGYRNGWSLPYRPYNISAQSAYNVTLVPLNIMDTTLRVYSNDPREELEDKLLDYVTKSRINSVISILWHNPYFTDLERYTGYLDVFERILSLAKELGIRNYTPTFSGSSA